MKIKLISDFRDFYDHHFDIDGFIYHRNTHTHFKREDDLKLLRKARFYTPKFGRVYINNYKMIECIKRNGIVLYEDEYQHKAEGKILILNINDLNFNKYEGMLWSEYIPSEYAYHWRMLTIGDFYVYMKYTSDHIWMSNKGNVIVEIVQYGYINDSRLEYIKNIRDLPLIGVDGRYYKGNFVTFDLNTAPQLMGTGIEAILKPKDVVNLIKKFYK